MIAVMPAPSPDELAAILTVLDAAATPAATPQAPAVSRWRAAARKLDAEMP